MVTIALDAMGSDEGPEAVVAGAAALSREDAEVEVLLVGAEPELSELLPGVDRRHERLGADELFSSFFREVTGEGLNSKESSAYGEVVNELRRAEREPCT